MNMLGRTIGHTGNGGAAAKLWQVLRRPRSIKSQRGGWEPLGKAEQQDAPLTNLFSLRVLVGHLVSMAHNYLGSMVPVDSFHGFLIKRCTTWATGWINQHPRSRDSARSPANQFSVHFCVQSCELFCQQLKEQHGCDVIQEEATSTYASH